MTHQLSAAIETDQRPPTNGALKTMTTLMRFTIGAVCLCMLTLGFSACAQKEDETMKAIREQLEKQNAPITDLVAVSFQKSADFNGENFPPYSHSFRAVRAVWSAKGTSEYENSRYTIQLYCLEGPVYASIGDKQQALRDTVKLCFEINDHPEPYSLKAPPVKTGTFPIGQLIPGKMFSNEVGKVVGVRLEVKEYTKDSNYPNKRTTTLFNKEAEGTLEITLSTVDKIAGKFDLRDSNLVITGNFDCLVTSFFMK